MKTLKSFKEEAISFFTQNPQYFKKIYRKRMGGTQVVVIEDIGRFVFDDRVYYKGRKAKYNNPSMHENLGEVFISKKEFLEKVNARADFQYKMQKNKLEAIRQYKKAYNNAVSIIGKDKLDEGIALVKSFKSKTYYFIDNVLLYHAYRSDAITIEVVTDEFRRSFNWDEWYSAPYASRLGMTPENKNLFIC